jgi:hypothetical protein
VNSKPPCRPAHYAWPGGYPQYFIAGDGNALSFAAVHQQIRPVMLAVRHTNTERDWQVVAIDVNWEDELLFCADTGQPISCAYRD